MIKIYRDWILWTKVPWFMWRDKGRLLNFLRGINLIGGQAEPHYLALLDTWGGGGYRCFQIPGFVVVFRRRKPYMFIQHVREDEREIE